jgi:hypothetical protein
MNDKRRYDKSESGQRDYKREEPMFFIVQINNKKYGAKK